jgi:SAM-dependent methyltransferase
MCNVDCFKWLAGNITEEEVKGKKVIEVGSRDINGSLRYVLELLKPSEYVGVDIKEGPCVDVICRSENLVKRFGKESFDIVISTNTLEHIRDWKTAISNIKNICKTSGIILIIVPSSWPFHEYPHDFWRYSKEDIREIFSDCDILELDEDGHSQSLAYTKISKPVDFNEKDLTLFKLHSVVTNRREKEIHDKDFRTPYYRMLVLKNKTKGILRRAGRLIF